MARFTLPRDLYHGKGALEALKTFTGKKAIVCVGGGSMKRFGFLDRAVSYLKEVGMEVELFEGIEPDPSVETVMRGAEAMLKFEPDWIIAMGGGSPIDAAKAMWIKYEYPEITFEEMCKVFGIPPLRRKAHFCAISSTSGTATEVTAFSIITDYQKGIKYPIADFEITPDVAIVDPDLAETMPKKKRGAVRQRIAQKPLHGRAAQGERRAGQRYAQHPGEPHGKNNGFRESLRQRQPPEGVPQGGEGRIYGNGHAADAGAKEHGKKQNQGGGEPQGEETAGVFHEGTSRKE